ncbi:hypothetical protein F511_11471 [Dorcoceras hygrometricum]|uniref:Uncharacterized protein n=1 Tax=Dorcoceras hygrometricum TaxID=472368 RepID=A0A2Z7CY97_9LAMI|nr:hypothetical protein F511_11471 [Dorcoceras hygrometricum]
MEVWVPCDTPTRQNISGNSGFSLDPHKLTRCNARDFTMNELKTRLTEFLSIQDNQNSTSGFCLSSDRNAASNLVKNDGGHEDSTNGISSSPESLFNEYATFTPPGELEVEELIGGKEMLEMDVTTELHGVNSTVEQSLPTPVKLVSAMKGNREKQGIPNKKLSVKWAPDVYDPVPASVSHFPSYNNQHCRNNGKRYGKNKQKAGSKSLRGSKGKDKKQARRNSGKGKSPAGGSE